MILRVLDDAVEEIKAAQRYLAQLASSLSERFAEDLAETFDAVSLRPESFSKLETLPDALPYRRALLSVFRYAVVFEIIEEEVLVVAVTHTSREPNYWLDRLY